MIDIILTQKFFSFLLTIQIIKIVNKSISSFPLEVRRRVKKGRQRERERERLDYW